MTAILLFFLPGALLLLFEGTRKEGLSQVVCKIVALSMAFFIVTPWFIRPLHLPLQAFIYFTLIVSLLTLIAGSRKLKIDVVHIDKVELLPVVLLIVILMLRIVPMFTQIAPAGADMSMHSYIARMIYDNDGIPSSYEPLLPVSNFGAYPAGLPTLAAEISLTSGLPVHRSALLVSCLAHAFVTFGLYLMLLAFFDRRTSILTAAAVSFIARAPQWIIRWGGNPTVLAVFLFTAALSILLSNKENRTAIDAVFCALLLAATLMTQTIIFYAGCFVILSLIIIDIKPAWKERPYWLTIGGVMVLLLFPYLLSLRATLTPAAVQFAKDWQAADIISFFYDLLADIPLIILCGFGAYKLWKSKRPALNSALAMIVVLLMLIVNYRFWFLPFSYILYPGRVAALLILPFSLLAAIPIGKIFERFKGAAAFIGFIGLIYFLVFYVFNSYVMSSVTRADMDAFSWISSSIGRKAVFANNYGDAGIWIPAIVDHTVTKPHSEPVNGDELGRRLKGVKPSYIYIGSKAVYKDVDYRKEDLEAKPWKYKRVYTKDGAQVWKILY